MLWRCSDTIINCINVTENNNTLHNRVQKQNRDKKQHNKGDQEYVL